MRECLQIIAVFGDSYTDNETELCMVSIPFILKKNPTFFLSIAFLFQNMYCRSPVVLGMWYKDDFFFAQVKLEILHSPHTLK